MMAMDDLKSSEKKILDYWEKEKIYRFDAKKNRPGVANLKEEKIGGKAK